MSICLPLARRTTVVCVCVQLCMCVGWSAGEPYALFVLFDSIFIRRSTLKLRKEGNSSWKMDVLRRWRYQLPTYLFVRTQKYQWRTIATIWPSYGTTNTTPKISLMIFIEGLNYSLFFFLQKCDSLNLITAITRGDRSGYTFSAVSSACIWKILPFVSFVHFFRIKFLEGNSIHVALDSRTNDIYIYFNIRNCNYFATY